MAVQTKEHFDELHVNESKTFFKGPSKHRELAEGCPLKKKHTWGFTKPKRLKNICNSGLAAQPLTLQLKVVSGGL